MDGMGMVHLYELFIAAAVEWSGISSVLTKYVVLNICDDRLAHIYTMKERNLTFPYL